MREFAELEVIAGPFSVDLIGKVQVLEKPDFDLCFRSPAFRIRMFGDKEKYFRESLISQGRDQTLILILRYDGVRGHDTFKVRFQGVENVTVNENNRVVFTDLNFNTI